MQVISKCINEGMNPKTPKGLWTSAVVVSQKYTLLLVESPSWSRKLESQPLTHLNLLLLHQGWASSPFAMKLLLELGWVPWKGICSSLNSVVWIIIWLLSSCLRDQSDCCWNECFECCGQVKMTANNLQTIPLLKAKESSGKIALQNVNWERGGGELWVSTVDPRRKSYVCFLPCVTGVTLTWWHQCQDEEYMA